MPRPDFFLVGAFKSGTTALHDYLRQHPQVFMPHHKEPLFFGNDLTRRYGRMTEREYLNLFRDARPGQRIGEASAWYLYSRSAPHEILAFQPAAQILAILRNPVDVMYAQHSQLLFNVEEDIADFAEALAAEPERRAGRRLPPGPIRLENLYYRESVRFDEQLERYFDVFGRERVLVLLYDDLRSDPGGTYRRLLEFLGVDAGHVPAFEVRNPNKRVRSSRLQRAIYHPPDPLLHLAPTLRRFRMVHRVRHLLLSLNSSPSPRRELDAELRARLTEQERPHIERLSALIGRDLSAWLLPGRGA